MKRLILRTLPLPDSVTSSILNPDIILSTLLSNIPVYVLPLIYGENLTYNTKGEIVVLFILMSVLLDKREDKRF
jgi:hypothetical protein